VTLTSSLPRGTATPQQNHLAELALAHIANSGRALMARAHIPQNERYRIFKKAFSVATKPDGLTVITLHGKEATRYEHFGDANPAFAKHLCTWWGEAGTVTLKVKSTPKVGDRGIACMMVDYAPNHAGNVYEMWDPTTNRIHTTRDVIWLCRMFYEQPPHLGPELAITPADDFYIEDAADVRAGESTAPRAEANQTQAATQATPVQPTATAGEDSGDNEARQVDDNHYDVATEEIDNSAPPLITRSGRATNPPDRLIETINMAQAKELNAVAAEFEISLTAAEEKYYTAMKELGELALVGAAGENCITTEQLKPMKYAEAMAMTETAKWVTAVEEEHNRMVENNVWEVKTPEEVP
jgi:hypothetical protein